MHIFENTYWCQKTMPLTAASAFVLTFIYMSGVQGQSGWCVTYSPPQICAIKGSAVDLRCDLSHPAKIGNTAVEVTSLKWFTKGKNDAPLDLTTDQDYTGRVEYKSGCSVTIRDVRETDSAVYKIRFTTNHQNGRYTGLPGVNLTVSALEVQVINPKWRQNNAAPKMKCKSKCLPDQHPYHWIRNGQDILATTPFAFSHTFSDTDRISCAAAGFKEFPSPSLYVPKLPTVSLSSSDIVEGSPVTLTCTSDANPAATYTWFEKNSPGSVSKGSQLVFRFIRSSDSGEYYCTAENVLKTMRSKVIFIDVKYAPRPPVVSVSSSGGTVEGSSVTLACSTDANPAANYTWYKKTESVPLSKGSKLLFKSVQSSDSGQYFCTAENVLKMMTSEDIFIDVEYAPRLPLVSLSPLGEITEGISLTLTCSGDANPAANYTWTKDNEDSPSCSRQNFTISNIGQKHGGLYYCEAHNKRGSHKSAIHFTVVARMPFKIMNITKLAVAILLVLILLFVVTLRMRKKKATGLKTESKELKENLKLGLDTDYENISALRTFIASQKEEKRK